jgi:hypothetical protein
VAESAIPARVNATSTTFRRWVITAPFGAVSEAGLLALAL